tara:strand:- start:4413 stop:5222 length:810 start_codon:yes stop_codon:yes gene_type:complete
MSQKVEINQLHFAYDTTTVLEDIQLGIPSGEIVVLLGPNGCGKTTLLKHISGLLPSKQVTLDQKTLSSYAPKELAKKLAAVEQHVQVGFDFTVQQLVEMGRLPHQSHFANMSAQDTHIIEEAMRQTNVHALAERPFTQLSSGERQRVWLSVALAQQPQVLLLDEPTSHLDLHHQMALIDSLRALAEGGLTLVISMHELTLAGQLADTIVLLKRGRIIASGPPIEVLTSDHIKEVYQVETEVFSDETGAFWGVIPKRSARDTPGNSPNKG